MTGKPEVISSAVGLVPINALVVNKEANSRMVGKPVASLGEGGAGAKSLYAVARAVAKRLEEVAGSVGGPSFQID